MLQFRLVPGNSMDKPIEYSLGDKPPHRHGFPLDIANIAAIRYVTADGDELEYIIKHMIGLPGIKGIIFKSDVKGIDWSQPINTTEKVTWTGDHASFILANFPGIIE